MNYRRLMDLSWIGTGNGGASHRSFPFAFVPQLSGGLEKDGRDKGFSEKGRVDILEACTFSLIILSLG